MESGSLVKAFDLLEGLADRGGAASLAELSVALHLAKPTAYRVLQSLLTLGYLHHEAGGTYRLTPKLRWLTMGFGDRRLAAIAHPILHRLHADTDETVNLGVLRRNRICYVTILESSQPLRRVADLRDSDPILCTALGRAIVAYLPAARQEQLLKSMPVEPRTPRTVTSSKDLRQILSRIRHRGYAIERDQTDVGVTCVAAAVLLRGDPIAAVSLSIPSARVDSEAERQWITQVRCGANALAKSVVEGERASA
jgi:IclR family transcriptional regulator, KDG regulon repressor